MDHEAELLKGNTQTLILAVLNDGPLHGYAIAREIERRSESGLKFRDGTLYPALQQLERQGLITGAWEPSEQKPPRKVYRMTPEGATELARRLTAWRGFVRTIDRVLGDTLEAQGAS